MLAAEKFRNLKDGEIKARFAGMETTDGAHWAEQYMRDGSLKAFDMGKPITGKWYVRNGELCLQDAKKKEPECKEVWAAGTRSSFAYQRPECRQSRRCCRSSSRANEKMLRPGEFIDCLSVWGTTGLTT